MKNTMIFLHGKGVPSKAPQYEIFKEVAAKENADYLIIDAPFPHRDGFRWHNYNREPGEKSLQEFKSSLLHIETEAEKIMRERGIGWSDIIWIGHSQGSDMAIMTALKHGAKKVIGMMPSWEPEMLEKYYAKAIQNSYLDFPIYWVEAENDTVLSKERKAGWKKLKVLGANVIHTISKGSGHDSYARTVLYYDTAQ